MRPACHVRYLPAAILAVALLALFGLAAGEVHDYDIFWQLQSGRYMLESGSFIRSDLFSLAADVPRFEHCWLHDMVFYGVYALAGYAGVSLLKALLITATAGALVAVARQRQAGWAAIALIAPTPFLMTFWAWKERPQLWTYLFFALFLLLLERYRRSGGQSLWWLLLLTALWANLHAGAVLAVPLLLAQAVGEWGDRRLGRSTGSERQLWLATLFVPLALLATPYATALLETLVYAPQLGEASGQLSQLANIDWLPTTLAGYPGYFKALVFTGILLALNWRRVPLSDLLLLGGLAFMGVKLERHTPFFFFAMAALLPVYVKQLWQRLIDRIPGARHAPLRYGLLLLALLIAIYSARPAWQNYGFLQPGLRSWHYPVAEAEFVCAERLPGNLFNSYGVGGYLMWTLYPDYRVFWDGRQDSAEMFRLGLLVSNARPGWEAVLERFGVNVIVHEACSQASGARFPLLDALGRSPDWALARTGESHVVFVRRRAVPPAWLRRFELPAGRLDETVFNAALRMLQESPLRPEALREVALIAARHENSSLARKALDRYLEVVPAARRAPEIMHLDRSLPR